MKLENWAIISIGNEYTAPEVMRYLATGEVYGNPEFPDGYPVTTSYLRKIDLDGLEVHTRNSVYTLGNPKEDYLEYLKDHKPEWYNKLA